MVREIPILESGEPLVPIPAARFVRFDPPPYVAFGAPYGRVNPWFLRQGVLHALETAQVELGRLRPGWRFKLFDAWRPLVVQAFMVWREFGEQARMLGYTLEGYEDTDTLRERAPQLHDLLAARVYEFWSLPDQDPHHPPPHSTGAAVDLTLVDAQGREVPMGSPIDEVSPRSWPDYFASSLIPAEQVFHANRELLHAVLHDAGFCRHPNEWWHFSLGDQLWAMQHGEAVARYGRTEPD